MSLSTSFSSDTSEVTQLRDENKLLRQEIKEKEADREYVFSLWKMFQVSKPVVAEAIAFALERQITVHDGEMEKLIALMSEKDARIEELTQQVVLQNQEMTVHLQRRLDLQNSLEQHQLELKDCFSKISCLQKQVADLELRDVESASREAVRELDGLNLELKKQLNARDAELEQLRIRNSGLIQSEIEHSKNLSEMASVVQSVNEENATLQIDSKTRCKKYETELRQLKKEVQFKDSEMEAVRKELSKTWQSHRKMSEFSGQQEDLIQQLRSLLADTQQMLHSQEEVFLIEIEQEKQTVIEQNRLIDSLREKLERFEEEMVKIQDKRHLQEDIVGHPFESEGANASDERFREQEQKLEAADQKMASLRDLLMMKNKELEALRSSHSRRLERLRSVLASCNLMKQQLKLFHEDPVGSVMKEPKTRKPRPRSKSLQRLQPKTFQKEDCDLVWNELDQLKKEFATLKAENVQLLEESDMLRIESTNSATTIHELKCCLEEQGHDLKTAVIERDKLIEESELLREEDSIRNARLNDLIFENAELIEESRQLKTDLEIAQAENQIISSDLKYCHKQEMEQRGKITELKKEMISLQKKLRKRLTQPKAVRTQTRTVRTQTTSKQSKPSKRLPREYDGDDDEDGDARGDRWQDISERGDDDDRTLASDSQESSTFLSRSASSGNSLGQSIVEQAQSSGVILSSRNKRKEPVTDEQTSKPLLTNRQKHAIKVYVLSLTKTFLRPQTTDVIHPVQDKKEVENEQEVIPSQVSKGTRFPNSSSAKRIKVLKQRISSLMRQTDILRREKESILAVSERQKRDLESLHEQLNTATQKVVSNKHLIHRLTGDVDKLRAEKEYLEKKMSEYTFEESACSARSDQEVIGLQKRLESASAAMSKQLEQIKQLRVENHQQQDKIAQLTLTNDRLKQDVNNKRTLIEDYRLKLAEAEENLEAEADIKMMLEVESKLKSLAEENGRLKTKVECLSKRVAVASREKSNSLATIKKLYEEIDRKSKIVTDLQASLSSAERTATTQLRRLTSQTESAVDAAKSRLAFAEGRIQDCSSFIKMLAHSLLGGLKQGRLLLHSQRADRRRKEEIEHDSSLIHAKQLACEILNIGEKDLSDIMSISGSNEDDERELNPTVGDSDDLKWAKKCEAVLQSEGKFAFKLVDLFVKKIEERCQLAAQLSSS